MSQNKNFYFCRHDTLLVGLFTFSCYRRLKDLSAESYSSYIIIERLMICLQRIINLSYIIVFQTSIVSQIPRLFLKRYECSKGISLLSTNSHFKTIMFLSIKRSQFWIHGFHKICIQFSGC